MLQHDREAALGRELREAQAEIKRLKRYGIDLSQLQATKAIILQTEIERLRAALAEAREALATLDHMNGRDDGLAVIRGGKPIKHIIDAALGPADEQSPNKVEG